MNAPCFVYFVQAGEGGNIKIGVSRNPARRITKMQTDAPHPLSMLLVIIGDERVEHGFHAELAEHRVCGEWFSPAPAVLALIDRERSAKGNVEYIAARQRKATCALQAWRHRAGLTIQELADKIGVSHASISRAENFKQALRWESLEAIYHLTSGEVTPNDFAPWLVDRPNARASAQ